ncbi:bifunctional Succinyl-CoA synthetase [Babesia duncani]|uniref:Succinyl-CoA synthetase beta chain n=1 Tax=Babesia duncani TaxID=323732 RepID=A0AAD9PJ41_9APIC|nr:bifunctional Succinyl-CoA synthetase [Babesia duncani]
MLSHANFGTITSLTSCLTSRWARQSKRFLNISEFAGMNILKNYNVRIPSVMLARTPSEAVEATKALVKQTGCSEIVVKALVATGGRGKGKFENSGLCGVQIVNETSVYDVANGMLGHVLVTKQTGAAGIKCQEVILAEKLSLVKERYVAFMLDRASGGIVAIATRHGGGNVEEIAEKDPDAVLKVLVNSQEGIAEHVARIAQHLDFSESCNKQLQETIQRLYDAFVKSDALLLEVNPLAETANNEIVACDSKITIDDNAQFRQEHLFKSTRKEATAQELEAEKYGLSYVSLGGNIACIVNGAGLAMATLDLLTHHGGSPANFLDVGGTATSDTLAKALEIVNSDENAKVLFVNIVGGIVHCDVFAKAFIEAASSVKKQLPVIIRLQGSRADVAKMLLTASNIPHLFSPDFDLAAKAAVEAVSN